MIVDSWESSGEPWEPAVPDELPRLADEYRCDVDGHVFESDVPECVICGGERPAE